MITSAQIRKIHTLKNKLFLDDETYREILKSFGVTTSKDLTFAEASLMLEFLEKNAVSLILWKKYPKKYEDLIRDEKMATPSQLRMIEGLWFEISYFKTDKFARRSIRKFLKRTFNRDDIMFLTKTDARKIIPILKKIKNYVKKV